MFVLRIISRIDDIWLESFELHYLLPCYGMLQAKRVEIGRDTNYPFVQ